MGSRARVVQVLGCAGFVVSLYALYVERAMAANPFYEPACVTRWGSCATVFGSDYAHLLSHWGLVPKRSPLDLSLAAMGMANYGLYAAYPWLWPGGAALKATLLLAIATASVGFSVYLLYVLKVILRDFCVVCTTFHLINFSMFFFGALPEYRAARTSPGQKKGA